MKRKSQQQLFTLTCLALLTAMQIVIARFFSILVTESIRFSFAFIPVVIAARRFGPLGGMLVYGCLIALVYVITKGKAPLKKSFSCAGCPNAANCHTACTELPADSGEKGDA